MTDISNVYKILIKTPQGRSHFQDLDERKNTGRKRDIIEKRCQEVDLT